MPKRPNDGSSDIKAKRRRRRDSSSSSSSTSSESDEHQELSETELIMNAIEATLGTRLTPRERRYLLLSTKRLKGGIENDIEVFRRFSPREQYKILDTLDKIKNGKDGDKSHLMRVLESDADIATKTHIIKKIEQGNKWGGDTAKVEQYVENVVRIPFSKYTSPVIDGFKTKVKVREYITKSKDVMDKYVYGQELAKNKFLQVIAQSIANPKANCSVIGLVGPMGSGKTKLVQEAVSRVLNKPFMYIPLGGSGDISYLQGFSYCWEGSHHGKIMDCVMKAGVCDPVFYFDELDKISDGWRGWEIINFLIQLVDIEQNKKYEDRYFAGLPIDLSRATFIFSYNDSSKVNHILRDRITEIHVKGYKTPEKVHIAAKYMIPKILEDVGIKDGDVIFEQGLLEYIIETYTHEGGVRKFKEKLYEIIREVNLRIHMGKGNYKLPLIITKRMIMNDLLLKFYEYTPDKIEPTPTVGKMNGLYTTCNDTGGLIPIEVVERPSDKKFDVIITGMLGDVMKESTNIAKTVAWNIIPQEVRDKWNKKWEDSGPSGLHIHFTDGSTSKDGPSAGLGICASIVSRLTGIPIKNTVAITGEINLFGQAMKIGGLGNKLYGAKKAGVTLVLFPEDNKKDLKRIKDEHPDLIDDKFQVKAVTNINQVIQEVLVHNKLNFQFVHDP